jgi:hypothetical protein
MKVHSPEFTFAAALLVFIVSVSIAAIAIGVLAAINLPVF